jgi:hypothetical protein
MKKKEMQSNLVRNGNRFSHSSIKLLLLLDDEVLYY